MDVSPKKPDSKGLAAMIVAGAPKAEAQMADEVDDGGAAEDMDEGQIAAADEAMAALKTGDAKAFAEALKAFVEMCSY